MKQNRVIKRNNDYNQNFLKYYKKIFDISNQSNGTLALKIFKIRLV